MYVYYTPYAPVPEPDSLLALLPPIRRKRFIEAGYYHPGPLFAYALLSLALDRHYGISAEKAIRYTDQGRPYLPGTPVHLSMSHSKTHALCVLADFPVGCDIETHRPISDRAKHRILAPCENPADFFAHWTLKECAIKLAGRQERPLSQIPFTITGDLAQGDGVHGWLYGQIPNATAAVLAHLPFPKPDLTRIDPELIFSHAAKKL